MKIAITINTAWNLINFREGLILKLIAEGHEVIAIAPIDKHVNRVKLLGCQFFPIKINNHGMNPLEDVILFVRFLLLFRTEKPDIILSYTIKPNIYSSFAAYFFGIPVVNNIAGLGSVFVKKTFLTRVVRGLYKIALLKSVKIFFQNEDDRSYFVQESLVNIKLTDTVPGSGIDLKRFEFVPFHNAGGPVRFLLIGRMLWDKGVGELVQATRLLKKRGFNFEVCLLGFLDLKNPRAIGSKQMEEWVEEGVVSFLGEAEDVRPHIIEANCIILPSFYREGVPRSLLEAAAMGRPIITTDSVGCKEVVDDGVNGFLCQPRNVNDLMEKMERFIMLSAFDRAEMGRFGREKVERNFDEMIVISKYLQAIAGVRESLFRIKCNC
jgi:glycosyltransferase involved in cell wall biosynthesis